MATPTTIKAEYLRATAAEATLQKQIDALKVPPVIVPTTRALAGIAKGAAMTSLAIHMGGGTGTVLALAGLAAGHGVVRVPAVNMGGLVITVVGASGIGQTTATITWTISAPATGQVEYGPTLAYGSFSALENSYVYTTHVQSLSGLAAGTPYHFRVHSTDATGSSAVSADYTFTTAAFSGQAPDWSDEFAGGLSLWTVRAGQAAVSGGLLTLTMVGPSPGISASILTNRTFDHGYFEVRMKWPKGSGFDCSVWMYPEGLSTPIAEIDIIEAYPNNPYAWPGPNAYQATMHWPSGGVDHNHQITFDAGYDLTDTWHIVGCNWLPGSRMEFYFDGASIGAFTADVLPATPPLNLYLSHLAASWSDLPNQYTPFPSQMQVDWVRWWSVKP